MTVSMQVIYPVSDGSTFDFDYYLGKHFELVGEHFGPHIAKTLVTRGNADGAGKAAGYHAIATIVFPDQDAFNAAMKAAGPVMADVPNFTNVQPDVLIGEVVG